MTSSLTFFSDGRTYIDSSRISSRIIIRPRAPTLRLWASLGDRREGVVGEFQADIVELELPLILLDQCVLRLGQDRDQRRLVELVQRADDRQAADEFGDQAVMDQILGLELVDRLRCAAACWS